jgi:hypothetical protein
MITSSLPSYFWAEAVSTSVYLIIMQPSASLQGAIPLEWLFGHSSDYSMLHLFGCVCYIRTKISAQSVVCAFLGYSDEHNCVFLRI